MSLEPVEAPSLLSFVRPSPTLSPQPAHWWVEEGVGQVVRLPGGRPWAWEPAFVPRHVSKEEEQRWHVQSPAGESTAPGSGQQRGLRAAGSSHISFEFHKHHTDGRAGGSGAGLSGSRAGKGLPWLLGDMVAGMQEIMTLRPHGGAGRGGPGHLGRW